jgi:lipoate-protein ligase A
VTTIRHRHGEYKTPGGKLVVVDFDLVDDTLQGVQLAGDFFLYPDELHDRLQAALEGMPVGLSSAERQERLDAVLQGGGELMGVTTEAIAEAIRRGLEA